MYSILPYAFKESIFVKLVNLTLKNIKDSFPNLRGKVGELLNQRRGTLARDIIRRLYLRPYYGAPPTPFHPYLLYLDHNLLFMYTTN